MPNLIIIGSMRISHRRLIMWILLALLMIYRIRRCIIVAIRKVGRGIIRIIRRGKKIRRRRRIRIREKLLGLR